MSSNTRMSDLELRYPEEWRMENWNRHMEHLGYHLGILTEPVLYSKPNPAALAEGMHVMTHRWDTPPREIVLHYV